MSRCHPSVWRQAMHPAEGVVIGAPHHPRRPAPGRAPRHQGRDLRQERNWAKPVCSGRCRRTRRCSSTSKRATSPSRAGAATRSARAPGRNAATSRCSSAGRTRRCAMASPTARRITTTVCAKFGDPRRSTATRRCSSTRSPSPGGCASSGAKEQPEAFSEKTGKPDIRGAYGLHGREMIGWITHLQHTRVKNVVLRRHPRREAR